MSRNVEELENQKRELLAILSATLWVLEHPEVNALRFCGNPRELAQRIRLHIEKGGMALQASEPDSEAMRHGAQRRVRLNGKLERIGAEARNNMITNERLAEIEAAPREARIFKFEAKELADAYRDRVPGLRVTKGVDGAWLHFEAPSGKKAAISLEALGVQRAGLVGATLLEWVDAL